MENKKIKLEEIYILTTILCICVVFIHLLSDPVIRLNVGSLQHTAIFVLSRIITFAVPGFIFLSGLKLGHSYKNKEFVFFDFLKKRFSKIFISYAVWYFIYYFLFRYLDFVKPMEIEEHAFSFIMGTMVSPFYFITVIFQFYLLFGVFLYLFKKYNNKMILGFTAVISIVYLIFVNFKYSDRFFLTYLVYFVIGVFAAFNMDKFRSFASKYKMQIFIVLLLVTVNNIYFAYGSRYLGIIFTYYRLKECIYSVLWILLLYNFSFYFSNKFSENIINKFKKIDGASYYIFLSHCSAIYICGEIWQRMGQYSIIGRLIFSTVIVFITVFPMCIVFKKMAKKS